jgi:hypothetical protein
MFTSFTVSVGNVVFLTGTIVTFAFVGADHVRATGTGTVGTTNTLVSITILNTDAAFHGVPFPALAFVSLALVGAIGVRWARISLCALIFITDRHTFSIILFISTIANAIMSNTLVDTGCVGTTDVTVFTLVSIAAFSTGHSEPSDTYAIVPVALINAV